MVHKWVISIIAWRYYQLCFIDSFTEFPRIMKIFLNQFIPQKTYQTDERMKSCKLYARNISQMTVNNAAEKCLICTLAETECK